MNKTLTISLLILLLPFEWGNTNKISYPNEKIQLKLTLKSNTFHKEIIKFLELAEERKIEQFKQQYQQTRQAYKSIETYVVFRYPKLDKSINGGPVPSITKDVVILHKDDPTGLQVIEELLTRPTENRTNIIRQLQLLEKNAQQIKNVIPNLPIQNWEILEANHLAITKLITLGLSGFDSPTLLLSINDAITVLKELKNDLILYESLVSNDFDFTSFQQQINLCIKYLEENTDFNDLNRFDYYRNYLVPLQKFIKKLHYNTGYETYSEVSNIKRSFTNADHLFSENYLDPYFSVRGNISNHNQEQIDLGRILFFDPILSKNNKRACASCHSPQKAFTDSRAKSLAFDFNGNVKRNSPTLINSCYQNNFFWDLRSSNMNDQIMNVILSKEEFNTTPEEIVLKLKQSNEYQTLFKKAFYAHKQPISISTIKASLEMFVRSLINLNSKFDKNIRSESTSLTAQEIDGANLFLGKAACATCHFPPNFNGFVPPHYNDTEGEILGTTINGKSNQLDKDNGVYERFKNSHPEAIYTKGMFKTPSIRNIEFTAPYMHNGMFKDLEEVVEFYNNGGGAGMGINISQQTLAPDSLHLSKEEKEALIAFMKTLSDTSKTNIQPFVLPQFSTPALNDRVWGGEY